MAPQSHVNLAPRASRNKQGVEAPRRPGASVIGLILLALLAASGCGDGRPAREPHREPPGEPPVDVFADTGRTVPLRITTPQSRADHGEAWLTRVSPTRPTALDLPEAGAASDTLMVPPSVPSASPAPRGSEALKPPIPRERAPLAAPAGGRGSVELDVLVDEQGRVTDTRVAGGSAETALVRAAVACATSMRFYPALLAGRPVAVWCRERFDFGVPQSDR